MADGQGTGSFIVVEGPEGAGKTTLVGELGSRLRAAGADVVEVREPGGTPLAEAARAIALDPTLDASEFAELFLMLAARADLVTKVIRPALARGCLVLSDRYELSTMAYQVVGRGLAEGPVLDANRLATGGLRPNLTLVLDVPLRVGIARQAARGRTPDRMERAVRDLHERVTRAFAESRGETTVHLDASRDPGQVADDAWEVVLARLGGPFGRSAG